MSLAIDKKFEFPGSIVHFSPRLKFTIIHMYLKITPNFQTKQLLNCHQNLKIKALQDIKKIILDVAELNIHKVSSEDVQIEEGNSISEKEDKFVINFKNIVKEKTEFEVEIDYSCGYYFNNDKDGLYYNSPRNGFHFILPDQTDQTSSASQSWTQGETMESRYWFPCIDDPQVKFTREIEVIAPDNDYSVISNGAYEKRGNVWKWIESTPIPAYLTSVVIGKFSKQEETHGKVSLEYYWPTNIPKTYDPMLTFGETKQVMRFFENYLDTKYPYEKYWQIAVDKFEFGGMENTTCTTLTSDILHDNRASSDYSRDIIIVAHELAHQWFGDLITCKDWSHIWLNEGFATYFELLYWRHKYIDKYNNKKNNDEFFYKIIQTIEDYIDEANNLYKRPIVTNLYKHADELFDSHSYEKGGLVLYMLSNLIGEEKFKEAIKKYLDTYRESVATTGDLQKICEDVYREDLQQFFKQWLYTAGHPELEIQFSLIKEKNNEGNQIIKIKIKIKQIQKEGFEFNFPLEVRIVCSEKNYDEDKIIIDSIENIQINKKETDYTFEQEILADTTTIIKWISIDPHLKTLKEIKSIIIVNQDEKFNLIDIISNQLESDIATISEKIASIQFLKDCYSKKSIELLKNVIFTEPFYGISVEAANVLGSYHDQKNYTKDNDSYNVLEKCITHDDFSKFAPQTRRAIITNIGLFERVDTLELKNKNSVPLLVAFLDDKSYFVENAAATAIGKSIKNLPNGNHTKEEMVKILKDKVVNSITFQDQLAQGAINGLRELSNDENIDLVQDIAELLIRKSSVFDFKSYDVVNRYFIRSAATLALGKFLTTHNDQVLSDKVKKDKIDKTNKKILNHLLTLLKDERRRVKINACTALADKDGKLTELNERITKSIAALRLVAEEDVDGFVRRNAEVNLNLIREWLKEWTNTPPKLEIKIRKNLEEIDNKIEEDEKTRKDERKGKKVISENDNEYEKIQRAAGKERLEY
jgi:aminopeptidase N